MKARPIHIYVPNQPPQLLYETEDGIRYTPEQWRLAEMMERLEKKIDKLLKDLP